MTLWPSWVEQLNHPESPLHLETPLIQLAGSAEEALRMQQLASTKPISGLHFIDNDSLEQADPVWPQAGHGAMLSENDGRIDPLKLLQALRRSLVQHNVELRATEQVSRGAVVESEGGGEGNRSRESEKGEGGRAMAVRA